MMYFLYLLYKLDRNFYFEVDLALGYREVRRPSRGIPIGRPEENVRNQRTTIDTCHICSCFCACKLRLIGLVTFRVDPEMCYYEYVHAVVPFAIADKLMTRSRYSCSP
jgi:hypothetical protein